MDLFEELKRSSSSSSSKDASLRPDTIAYSAAIDACARHRKWRRALQLLEEMTSSGLVPDLRCYACAIK